MPLSLFLCGAAADTFMITFKAFTSDRLRRDAINNVVYRPAVGEHEHACVVSCRVTSAHAHFLLCFSCAPASRTSMRIKINWDKKVQAGSYRGLGLISLPGISLHESRERITLCLAR